MSQWMPSMFASSLREPDPSIERAGIERGAIFAFENLLVAIAQGDSPYIALYAQTHLRVHSSAQACMCVLLQELL